MLPGRKRIPPGRSDSSIDTPKGSVTTGGKPWSQRLVRHRPPIMGPGPVRQGWLPHGSGVGKNGRESHSQCRWPGQSCRLDHELPFRGMVAGFRPQLCVHSHFETRFSPGTPYLSDIQSLLRTVFGGTSGAYPSFRPAGAGQARCHSSATRIDTRCTPDNTRVGWRSDSVGRQAVVKWCLSTPEGGVGSI